MIITFLKFIICSILIVIISKNILATTLRKLAQSMNLKSKTVGNIAGIATSVPELLSLGIAGFTGLIDTGIFNILSSNVINVLEYFLTVKINGNIKKMKNKVINNCTNYNNNTSYNICKRYRTKFYDNNHIFIAILYIFYNR